MAKRILAALLCVVLICLCVGCGKKTEGTDTSDVATTTKAVKKGEKISIIIEGAEENPIQYHAATEISKAYGDAVSVTTFPQGYISDISKATQVAMAIAKDTEVTAIIFATGVPGTFAAVKQVRAERTDVKMVVCNPVEDPALFTNFANLVLSVDYTALANDAVKAAKQAGAKNYVFYTTNRHLKYDYAQSLRTAMEAACKKEKLTFKASVCVDTQEQGRDLATAKLYIAEDAVRVIDKLGKDTALFCVDPAVQGAVAKAAVTHGMYMPVSYLPGPLAIAADLGVDMTGHESDTAYAMEKLKETAKTSGAAGHVGTWGFDTESTFLNAVMDLLNGKEAMSEEKVTAALNAHANGSSIKLTKVDSGIYDVAGTIELF